MDVDQAITKIINISKNLQDIIRMDVAQLALWKDSSHKVIKKKKSNSTCRTNFRISSPSHNSDDEALSLIPVAFLSLILAAFEEAVVEVLTTSTPGSKKDNKFLASSFNFTAHMSNVLGKKKY